MKNERIQQSVNLSIKYIHTLIKKRKELINQ